VRQIGVAYRPNATTIRYFTQWEDGTGKNPDVDARVVASPRTVVDPMSFISATRRAGSTSSAT